MSNSLSAVSDGLLIGVASSAVLCTPNQSRDALIIHNQRYVLYVKCGNNASQTDYTYRLTGNTTLELTGYMGAVSAIASQNDTYVRVTELV